MQSDTRENLNAKGDEFKVIAKENREAAKLDKNTGSDLPCKSKYMMVSSSGYAFSSGHVVSNLKWELWSEISTVSSDRPIVRVFASVDIKNEVEI